jgi:hypothetical protein
VGESGVWVKLDDRIYTNGKQLAMTNPAFRLYVCGLAVASEKASSHGFLARPRVSMLLKLLPISKRHIDELVALHAWEPVDDGPEPGWRIHDFEFYTRDGRAPSRAGTGARDAQARARVPVPSRPVPSRPSVLTPALKRERTKKSPRGRRSEGTNPRALGTNPRTIGTNPRAVVADLAAADNYGWHDPLAGMSEEEGRAFIARCKAEEEAARRAVGLDD